MEAKATSLLSSRLCSCIHSPREHGLFSGLPNPFHSSLTTPTPLLEQQHWSRRRVMTRQSVSTELPRVIAALKSIFEIYKGCRDKRRHSYKCFQILFVVDEIILRSNKPIFSCWVYRCSLFEVQTHWWTFFLKSISNCTAFWLGRSTHVGLYVNSTIIFSPTKAKLTHRLAFY